MISKKTETIQGFLTPNKLLSGTVKYGKQNSKGSKSPVGGSYHKQAGFNNSQYNSQNQSILNTSRQIERNAQTGLQTNASRITGQNSLIGQQNIARKYQTEGHINYSYTQKNSRINAHDPYKKSSFPIPEQTETYNNKQRTLEQINNRKWDTSDIRYDEYQQKTINNPRLRNDIVGTASFGMKYPKQGFNQAYDNNNGRGTQVRAGSNPQVMTVQCYQLIRKLSKIKQNLELEISELQTLLDNTSRHIQSMDNEFQKIKDNILTYTAKCLDFAFMEYKQNMVQWQKYEDFQRKSLTMLTQINQYIYNQEQKLSEHGQQLSYKQITNTAQELQNQIEYYGQFTEEIKRIREQCIGMRPTLTQDKIKEFEKGLAILCNF